MARRSVGLAAPAMILSGSTLTARRRTALVKPLWACSGDDLTMFTASFTAARGGTRM